MALVAALLAAQPLPDIRATKHNLSSTSTNAVRAVSEDQVCVFCHIPHGAYQSRPVWNRNLSYQDNPGAYTLYNSTTLDAIVPRPSGASKLCLSCHDGTLAIGSLMNNDNIRPASVAMQGGVTTMPSGPRNLGTDLRNDHPISMVPDPASDPEIVLPPAGDDVRLREGATGSAAGTRHRSLRIQRTGPAPSAISPACRAMRRTTARARRACCRPATSRSAHRSRGRRRTSASAATSPAGPGSIPRGAAPRPTSARRCRRPPTTRWS
jgi:hypothetical protein